MPTFMETAQQLFSWPHFLLPKYLRHTKEEPCSKINSYQTTSSCSELPCSILYSYQHFGFVCLFTLVTPLYLCVVSALDIPILVQDVLSSFMFFPCIREVGDKFRWGLSFFIHFEPNFFFQQTPVLLLTGLLQFMICHHYLATAPKGLSRTHQANLRNVQKLILLQISHVFHSKYGLNILLRTLLPHCFPWVW